MEMPTTNRNNNNYNYNNNNSNDYDNKIAKRKQPWKPVWQQLQIVVKANATTTTATTTNNWTSDFMWKWIDTNTEKIIKLAAATAAGASL